MATIKNTSGDAIASLPPSHGSYHFYESTSSMAEPIVEYGNGMPYIRSQILLDFMGFSLQEVAELFEVDPSTLFRWKKEDKKLSKMQTKAILDLDKIVAKGVKVFGSEALFHEWLQSHNFALRGQKPIELLKDPLKRDLVDDAVEAMAFGNIL
jgi:putative toxin-antitoxin system antitoxin component (TIGR02293 family)